MEVYVLDKDFTLVGSVDSYNSFIWTERYAEAGDFELSIPASFNAINLLQQDRYLRIKDSDTLMIIEKIEVKTENRAQHMIVSGRSIVSILDRRVVLGLRYLNYVDDPASYPDVGLNVWQLVKILLNENVINPQNAQLREDSDEGLRDYFDIMKNNRKISEIKLLADNLIIDPNGKIASKKPKNLQFGGETILDSIKNLCDKYHLGFKMTFNQSDNSPFTFSIYDGRDRTSTVILSPEFDNIANIGYFETSNGYKNIILAIGEYGYNQPGIKIYAARNINGTDLTTQNSPKGLNLREYIVDVSNDVHLELKDDYGELIPTTDENYKNRLRSRADELLVDNNKALQAFDGEIINNARYRVKEDYNLGDLIQMTDNLGHSAKMRITEIIYAHNASGYKIYPTLALYEKDEYEE